MNNNGNIANVTHLKCSFCIGKHCYCHFIALQTATAAVVHLNHANTANSWFAACSLNSKCVPVLFSAICQLHPLTWHYITFEMWQRHIFLHLYICEAHAVVSGSVSYVMFIFHWLSLNIQCYCYCIVCACDIYCTYIVYDTVYLNIFSCILIFIGSCCWYSLQH